MKPASGSDSAMPATSATADQAPEEFQWNIENEVHLYHAMIGNKPAGINKHFNMASICERLSNYTSKDVSSDSVWRYLDGLYNLEMLDDIEGMPFPNDQKDFCLPENEYGTLMKLKAKEIVTKIEEIEDRSASPRVSAATKSSSRGNAAKDNTPKSTNKKDSDKNSKLQKDAKDSSSGSNDASNTSLKSDKDSVKSDPRRDSKDSTSSTKDAGKSNSAKSTPAKESKSTKPSRSSAAADKSEDSSKSNDDTNSAKRGNKRSTRGSLKSEEPTPPSRRRRI